MLEIVNGRHPLQEKTVIPFIPNNTCMGEKGGRVHLLSGPNSSGKSVYMKQVGLIVYLAHLGCWVPANSATIPLVDNIFTRKLFAFIKYLDELEVPKNFIGLFFY